MIRVRIFGKAWLAGVIGCILLGALAGFFGCAVAYQSTHSVGLSCLILLAMPLLCGGFAWYTPSIPALPDAWIARQSTPGEVILEYRYRDLLTTYQGPRITVNRHETYVNQALWVKKDLLVAIAFCQEFLVEAPPARQQALLEYWSRPIVRGQASKANMAT